MKKQITFEQLKKLVKEDTGPNTFQKVNSYVDRIEGECSKVRTILADLYRDSRYGSENPQRKEKLFSSIEMIKDFLFGIEAELGR